MVAYTVGVGSTLDVMGRVVSANGVSGTVTITTLVLTLMMRFTTHHSPLRVSLPGALFIAIGWQVLQQAGSAYVRRVLTAADDMNGVFALVLGLVALICIGGVSTAVIRAILASRSIRASNA